MNNLTFQIFTSILFGDDIKDLNEKKYPYENLIGSTEQINLCEMFLRISDCYLYEYINPITSLVPPLNDHNYFGPWKRNHKNLNVFKKAIKKIISESNDKNSIWSILNEKGELTQDEILSDLILLILAGSETSSHVVVSMFYFLAKFPDARDKLRKEFEENGLTKGDDLKSKLTMDKIQSLDYLACVVKETLRMDSPVPASVYYLAKDNLRVCDVNIEKGTICKLVISTSKLSFKALNT